MFYEIYLDQSHVSSGALWYDPDGWEFVEVTDLDSSTGIQGVTMIQMGSAIIDEELIRKGAEFTGQGQERPPARPEGPREWSPSWRRWPPPKPGHLFWVPDPGPVEKYVDAWKAFEEEQVKPKEMPIDMLEALLSAAECAYAYRGMDVSWTILVVEKTSPEFKHLEEVRLQWGASQAVPTTNPDRTVWKALKQFGIKKTG